MAEILVVDDDLQICTALEVFLGECGHHPTVVGSAREALDQIGRRVPDVVLMDIRMVGTDGLTALARARERVPDLCVVMMTAYGTSHTAIEAMRLGAFDYLTKPFDLETLGATLERAIEARQLARHPEGDGGDGEDEPAQELVGESHAMVEVYKLLGLLAARGLPALLTGERGVGKHLAARTLHVSAGRSGPFVTVSCRGMTLRQAGEEILGRVGGPAAPGTPAVIGKLEAADGGTLVLDHFEDLPLAVQERLVHYLRDGVFERLGDVRPVAVDSRLVACSERDLGDLVRRGSLSEELYDRLRVFSISLPPLRERREDIPALTDHFLRRASRELGLSVRRVDDAVAEVLSDYSWPGNVGELENVVRRAAALARGEVITLEELGDRLHDDRFSDRRPGGNALELGVRRSWRRRLDERRAGRSHDSIFHGIVERVEEILVREALQETDGNQLRSARLLGITRATLRAKIRRFGI